MNVKKSLYILATILFCLSIFTYFYESRYSGLLPIITYPFRDFSIYFLIGGLIVIFIAFMRPGSLKE
ncbi:MAG: hypothetical protein ACTSR0_05240 [Candidatus Asgardarchaeia archaeon]